MNWKGRILLSVVWLMCSYVGEANWAAALYGEFGASGIETKCSAADSGLLINLLLGPFTMPIYWSINEYKPMWDWPKYAFCERKPLP